jgi:hypothetical protein
MKKTNQSAIVAASFNKTLYWLMLGSLMLAAACADGGYQTYRAPSYPSQSSPGYYSYPNYYGPTYPYEDPEYWRMWQDRQGGG